MMGFSVYDSGEIPFGKNRRSFRFYGIRLLLLCRQDRRFISQQAAEADLRGKGSMPFPPPKASERGRLLLGQSLRKARMLHCGHLLKLLRELGHFFQPDEVISKRSCCASTKLQKLSIVPAADPLLR
jgi:hypothetical protein